MAMKPMKKPVAKMAKMSDKAKPKTATTKSRGSKSATQVGNDNARELYNAYRGKGVKPGVAAGKAMKNDKSKGIFGGANKNSATARKTQRSGGSGK